MNYWESILLGLIQGIAEFLPISSSGHLVVTQTLLGRNFENLAFDVALHFGTLLSILVIYFPQLLGLLKQPRQMAAIIVATLPAVFVGLFLKDRVEAAFESPLVAGCGFCITSALLFSTLRFAPGERTLAQIDWRTALVVGLFQCLAITPGISRSGSTIVAGLLCGLKREPATTFSFYIAIPAILGATVLHLKDILNQGAGETSLGPVLAGTVVAFVVGVLALKALIRAVAAGRLALFAWYCLAAGIVTIAFSVRILSGTA